MSTLHYSGPFLTRIKNAVLDAGECCYRQCLRVVRPFRYWNFLSLLKFAHASLLLQGFGLFLLTSNRLLKNDNTSTTTRQSSSSTTSGQAIVSCFQRIIWLRHVPPRNSHEAWLQLTWFAYCVVGGGFPFYAVRHPQGSSLEGVFRRYIHPSLYWGFLGVYKIVFSTYQTVRIAEWLTNPRSLDRYHKWMKWTPGTKSALPYIQRERILQLQNLRYHHQWSGILKELNNPINQRQIEAVRIDNRWVAFGPLGSAIQDILDEAREAVLLRPTQVISFFDRLGRSFPNLQEVSIAMSLSLPLQAINQLLASAPHLAYLRLDGVAFSVHDLQPDLLEFGRSLHGLVWHLEDNNNNDFGSNNDHANNNNNNAIRGPSSRTRPRQSQCLALQTLKLEHCRLENDEQDPQLRQRYSMDLLLAPAIYAALMPPTRLQLQHLTLWVKCQRISALELAVALRDNTSLKSLDLYLTRDKSNEVDDNDNNDNNSDNNTHKEDPAEWIVLPLAQVLQYRNTSLTKLSLQLPTGMDRSGYSHRALRRMMECNESLQELHMIRADRQRRIRIPEVDFYLHLNRLGRREFRLDCAAGGSHHEEECGNDLRCYQKAFRRWVDCLIQERRNTAVVYYFLSLNPSLLLLSSSQQRGGRRPEENRKRQQKLKVSRNLQELLDNPNLKLSCQELLDLALEWRDELAVLAAEKEATN